jgi:hypothetical protein
VIRELGAVFFNDSYEGNNNVFSANNLILLGVGLHDLTDFNPNREVALSSADSVYAQDAQGYNPEDVSYTRTAINLQNAQGCSQFISNTITKSNNRWNRCTPAMGGGGEVPAPGTFFLLASGLAIVWSRRRNRRTSA